MGRDPIRLDHYVGIADDEVIEAIRETARPLQGSTAVHVNATNFGGGVAEILDNLVPLMNDVGVRADWRVLHGTPDFFEVTKKMHNALQGHPLPFSNQELELYEETNRRFAAFAYLGHDHVVIHDPQPCGLVEFVPHDRPWTWRCHIDITRPDRPAFNFVQPFVEQYARMVVSADIYRQPDVSIPQDIISPSIDPLSPKNMDLSDEVVADYLHRHSVPTDKPLITQVSRFDPWKDPEGVLDAFGLIRQEADCRLVFCYNLANDDPEGAVILDRMTETAADLLASGDVVFVRGDDPLLVNAIQRASAVVMQKSIREGFGLTVTEAMWKGTPVVASDVGGIPTQIDDGRTGFLVTPGEPTMCAERVVQLLTDRQLAEQIGPAAKEHVRKHFLITRHLLDYLELFARA